MFLRSYQSKRLAASFLADNNVFKEAIVKKALLILQGDAPKFILSYLSFSASLWNSMIIDNAIVKCINYVK